MSTTELSELRHTIAELKRCVGVLQSRYGDSGPVRRIANDVERLDIDASEFEQLAPVAGSAKPRDRTGIVYVPDTPYDQSWWQGEDDEGVGGHSTAHR